MKEELVVVGKIIKSQGNKGEVQVSPLTDDPQRFERLERIYLLQGVSRPRSYKIEGVWYHKNGRVVLKLGGCDCISTAQALVNAELAVEQKDLVSLPEDTYFHFQIIGLQAFTCEGQYLGQVEQIFPTGSNDVYVIKDGARECLVPAIEGIVRRVDIENKKLILKLPEGLA
jgi:16S rRNA processing protein RimM